VVVEVDVDVEVDGVGDGDEATARAGTPIVLTCSAFNDWTFTDAPSSSWDWPSN
jgi:hypothetical protein